MLRGQDILCVSSIDWEFNWQGHQEIMSTFAAAGNRVLFIENTGVRTPRWRDLPRLRKRLGSRLKSRSGFQEVRKNLWVYSPMALPFPSVAGVQRVNGRWLAGSVNRWMNSVGFRNPLFWTFLPTGLTLELMDRIPHSLAVYYLIADFEKLADVPERIRRTEKNLLQECDLIFAQGEELKARCAPFLEKVHIFPFGVQFELFERTRMNGQGIPPPMRPLRRPIIGYAGGLHKHMDFQLIRAAAAMRPDWTFLLIGPELTDLSSLRGIKNLVLLGEKPFSDLPAYMNGFDVGLIPYLLSGYTKTVYPTKLNEYHALGKPVVSTPLPEVVSYNRRYDSLVYLAQEKEEFVGKIEEALRNGDRQEAVQRRIGAAKENSWTGRIEQMSRLIEQRWQENRAS